MATQASGVINLNHGQQAPRCKYFKGLLDQRGLGVAAGVPDVDDERDPTVVENSLCGS